LICMPADQAVAEDLFPLVYAELRRRAAAYLRRERMNHTLQPTALVHEAWLQLSRGKRSPWVDRGHFMATAAIAMRQILVQHARRRKAVKRTPSTDFVAIDDVRFDDYDALDQALKRLESEAPELCRVVEARYFAGMSVEETAELLNVSPSTVKRYWMIARAWLNRQLGGELEK
jgi:RNA polymerase sigma factor (TIGR02999 family)